MKIGTRSVLFGVHAIWLHPFLIAFAWWQLYGFPWDPRLWLAFLVHDLGYLGQPNMDGPEGETHPELGAAIMRLLFGEAWGDFVLLHSRYYAKRLGRPMSRLCQADKLVFVLEPSWLYLPRVWLSGELKEFMERAYQASLSNEPHSVGEKADFASRNPWRWHRSARAYTARWLKAHKNETKDTWSRDRSKS